MPVINNGQHQQYDLRQQDQPVMRLPPEHLHAHNLQRQQPPQQLLNSVVPRSTTSAPSAQPTMTWLILSSPSSTWSTESSCRRSRQHANSIGRYSATLAPCHLWRPSPSLQRSNDILLIPGLNCQLPTETVGQHTSTCHHQPTIGLIVCLQAQAVQRRARHQR